MKIARRDSRINEAEVKIEQLNKEQGKTKLRIKSTNTICNIYGLAIIILLLISAISLVRGIPIKEKGYDFTRREIRDKRRFE